MDLVSSAKVASTFYSRLAGLMFRKSLAAEEALIFYQAPSIHTCFMRFPLDLIFLDQQMKVKRLVCSLPPWRTVFCKSANTTIELPAGKINQSNTCLCDKIEIIFQS